MKNTKQLDIVLCEVFRLKSEQLRNDLTMDDVASWDSLTHMDLIASLEENFSIELSMDEIMAMKDIKTIREIICEKVA